MADEIIRYEFEGDSSRLQQATQSAIDSLTLYEDTVKNIQSTINDLSSSINDVIDWMRLLSSEMKNIVSMTSTASNSFKDIKNASTQYANAVRSATTAQQKNTKAADDSTKAQKDNNGATEETRNVYKDLFNGINQVSRAFGSLKSSTNSTASSFNNLSNLAQSAVTVLKAFMGLDLAAIFKKSALSAMDYIENLNLFNVAMGDSIDVGKKFVNQVQEIYGLDPSNIMTYVGNFNQLASAIEMPAKAATTLSTGMAKISTDIASVFNMDVVDVINNMKSGLLGMTRAVTKYGMDIRTSTLQQTALTLGITDNVRKMSEANREGLRYITMVRQASNLSGDWAKTIESPANQMRILKEQLTQLSRAIGNLFLPIITKTLPYINGFVMALREAINAIAEFFGFSQMDFGGTTSTLDKTAGSLEDIGKQADETSKKIKALQAPFDELNVIQDTSSATSSAGSASEDSSEIMDPAIASAIEALYVPLENVTMKANQVRDAILSFFNLKGTNFTNVLTKLKDLLSNIKSIFDILKGKFTEAFTYNGNGQAILATIKGILSDIYNWFSRIIQSTKKWVENLNLEPIVSAFKNLLEAIRKLAGVIGDQLATVYENVLLPLGKWTIEKALPNVINAIANALNWFAEHPDVAVIIASIATAIGLVVKFIQGAILAVTVISSVVKGINTIIVATGLSLGSLIGIMAAVVLGIAAIIAIIALVILHLDEIKAWFADIKGKFSEFIENVKEKVQEFKDKLSELKDSLIEHFQPVIDVFQKIKDKFDEVKGKIAANVDKIKSKFDEIKSTLTQIFTALKSAFKKYIADPVSKWWEEHVTSPLTTFYNTYLKPVVDAVKKKVVNKIVGWFSNAIDLVADWFSWLGDVITNIFDKVTDFIAYVFDWVTAAVGNSFIWVINAIIGFFENLINSIVDGVNLLVAAANLVPGVAIDYVSYVELDKIAYFKLPKMATGGVVSRPTQATIGEGKYDEAIIPLGDSPQLNEMLDRFADKVNQQPINVVVKIGDKDWDAFTYQSSQRGQYLVGQRAIGGDING